MLFAFFCILMYTRYYIICHEQLIPSQLTLPSPGNLTRTGYTFGGWRDSAGNVFPVGFSWISHGGWFTFDAVWVSNDIRTITIRYHGNGHTGGTVPANQFYVLPRRVTLRDPGDMVREGSRLGGNMTLDGYAMYQPGVEAGNRNSRFDVPVRHGYAFNGWADSTGFVRPAEYIMGQRKYCVSSGVSGKIAL